MDNINSEICNANIGNNVLNFDTTLYSNYNYYIMPDYVRVFIIIGMLSIVINSVSLYILTSYKIETYMYIIMAIIGGILGLFGLIGYIILYIKSTFYNIIDNMRIYNNPSLKGNCNISLQYEGSENTSYIILNMQAVGFIKFLAFFFAIFILIQIILYIYLRDTLN